MSTEPARWPEWQQREEADAEYVMEERARRGPLWLPLLVAVGLLIVAVLVVRRMRAARRHEHTMSDHLVEGVAAGQELASTAGRKGVAASRAAMDRVTHSGLADRIQHRARRGRRFRLGPLRRH